MATAPAASLFAADPASDAWRPVGAAAADPALLDDLLHRIARSANAPSLAVAATWQLEKHAWFVAYGALLGLTTEGLMPDLDDIEVHDAPEGWIDDARIPAGVTSVDGPGLAAALEAHLTPLVDALAVHRPRRALWRCAGDRLAQAAGWVGGDALELGTTALGAPTALHAPCAFTVVDGAPFRWRTGCCLSYRCEGVERCTDCVLTEREAQRTARTSARSCS